MTRNILLLCVLALTMAALAGETPINLGRTSLAQVTGSLVNGGRAIDNPYYGVPNLFDEGKHVINEINYTYWLGDQAKPEDWVEVRFDAPVTVTAIKVSAPALFALINSNERILGSVTCNTGPVTLTVWRQETELTAVTVEIPFDATENGAIRLTSSPNNLALATGSLALPQPLTGVTCVRLATKQSCARIDELTILGYVPEGVKYTVGPPRIAHTAESSEAVARDAFRDWIESLAHNAKPVTIETPDTFITTLNCGDLPVLRVTIDKATGKTTTEMLVKLAPNK